MGNNKNENDFSMSDLEEYERGFADDDDDDDGVDQNEANFKLNRKEERANKIAESKGLSMIGNLGAAVPTYKNPPEPIVPKRSFFSKKIVDKDIAIEPSTDGLVVLSHVYERMFEPNIFKEPDIPTKPSSSPLLDMCKKDEYCYSVNITINVPKSTLLKILADNVENGESIVKSQLIEMISIDIMDIKSSLADLHMAETQVFNVSDSVR